MKTIPEIIAIKQTIKSCGRLKIRQFTQKLSNFLYANCNILAIKIKLKMKNTYFKLDVILEAIKKSLAIDLIPNLAKIIASKSKIIFNKKIEINEPIQ